MRRSGESRKLGGEESADANEQRRPEAPASDESSPHARLYPIWLKVEKPQRGATVPPPHLSKRTWTRLSRQIAAYLRARLNNNVTLRSLVRAAAAEMRLAGARPDDVSAALRRAVLEHPELSVLERTNVVTRRLASEELLDHMLDWARELDPPASP